MMDIKRGDIFYCNYSVEYVGSDQAGQRPVLVISNDVGNFHSPNVIVAAISSRNKKPLPTHMCIMPQESGLPMCSCVMFESIKTVSKERLLEKKGHLSDALMVVADGRIRASLGL